MDRRTFLYGSLAGVAAVTVGISVVPTAAPNSTLTDQQSWIIQALVPVVLAGTQSPQQLQQLAPRLVEAISQTIQTLPPNTRAQLDELLGLLDNRVALLALTGSTVPLAQRQPQQLTQILNQWRHHFLDTIKLAYVGLKEPIFAAYWGDPSHWSEFNYQAPSMGSSS
ncbi:twin-arginine translocation signal domain-containing protein [Ferrimonas lipolytica]|uniref:Twin-arginine translocation signal domain-containing protein n=1 Tax=Ferrimonas lipolytica TaxID=2724191 RepID=A0A6H1UFM1_9GAMM|nr:twin-arginine translocation signal domain-containing protein [Ferrimonas lipolytica]QIZ77844.1 twin-arginine translocation signal domain-containing protein [Ferrimonas lipolytica]